MITIQVPEYIVWALLTLMTISCALAGVELWYARKVRKAVGEAREATERQAFDLAISLAKIVKEQ